MNEELETMDFGDCEAPVFLKKSISYIDLNSTLVTQYLDAHPEFLNEYLRKSQIQRRMTILNDKNSGSKAILEKLRIQTQLNDLNPENIKTLSQKKQSLDSEKSVPKLDTKSHASFPHYELLTTTSEPNLTPVNSYPFNTFFDRQRKKEKREQSGKERKVFKRLGLHEKMFMLVKTLYQSLDLKTTCKKILNTVSLLLDADRCSLFLVVDDENSEDKKYLISVVFDAQSSNSIKQKDPEGENDTKSSESDIDEQIKIPYGKGIAGYVASTGVTLNIQDAYQDSRFNPTIDRITGYKTKSILCLPILDENGQCIAVAEAINKSNDSYEDINIDEKISDLTALENTNCFDKQDEEVKLS